MKVLRRSFATYVMRRWLGTLAVSALLGLSCAATAPFTSSPGASDSGARDPLETTPEQAQAEGASALARGDFEAALGAYQWAGRVAGPEDREGHYAALLGSARAQSALGEYAAAQEAMEEAGRLADAMGDAPRAAAARVALGGIELAQGHAARAETALRAGAEAARKLGRPALEAAALNDLGNIELLRAEPAAAADFYQSAASVARNSGDFGLAARSWANAVRAQRGQPARALASVARAEEALARVPDATGRSALLLNLGLELRDAAQESPVLAGEMRARSGALLEEALASARVAGNLRIQSQALGGLGGLAEAEGRVPEALSFTRRALETGRALETPESVYLWQAQLGRLLAEQGERGAAIQALERSVSTLQLLRDRPVWGGDLAGSSFDLRVAPVYRSLLDLLLLEASESADPARVQVYLGRARSVMENFKAAELRDFFRDDCVDAQRARTRELETVSRRATILYPILLAHRTALLVSAADGSLELVSVPVGREALEAEARALRAQLERQATRRYLVHAQRLYDWLIRPLEPKLDASGTDTLVFVPDGALLMIPMASLHDGEHFLVEKFALATTPGFDLVDPAPVDREALEALLAGISKSVDGEAPLPNVVEELRVVEALLGAEVMLDEAFLRSDLRESLEDRNFGIVHIATHAQFSADSDDTFLLAWDGRLGLDELAEDVGLFRFRDEPLELLTLSACETARGDDRAGLGLSGMAVKAGARSVLGSLWSVNDPAATALVETFYIRLMAGDSRAQALRAAQLGLLADFRYRHPAYWAPFLLIGTWL